MSRKKIPSDIAAKTLFLSDRTCCICRNPEKSVQIHHINGKRNNNELSNLSVLCFDCHEKNQFKGGFSRKLDSEQIILYRNDWYRIVAQNRIIKNAEQTYKTPDILNKVLMIHIDAYKENKEYELVAMVYDTIGNPQLRDKYIDLALKRDPSDETIIYLRNLQNKKNLIPDDVKRRVIDKKIKLKDWSQLARTYNAIGDHKKAIHYYCRTIVEDIDKQNYFASAYYLKELSAKELFKTLFEEVYRESLRTQNLEMEIKCLQELGWNDEIKTTVLEKRDEIKKSGNPFLLRELFKAQEKEKALLEFEERFSKGVRSVAGGNVVVFQYDDEMST